MLLDGKICFLQPLWTLAEQFDVILKVASALDLQLRVLWTLETAIIDHRCVEKDKINLNRLH